MGYPVFPSKGFSGNKVFNNEDSQLVQADPRDILGNHF